MKIMRKLAAALLAAVLAASLAVPSLAAFNQDTLNGIVMIRTGAPDEKGTMKYWRGTGFFVGTPGEDPEYIVTNCHVVEEFILAGKALGGGELHVLFDQNDEAEAYLVDYDAERRTWPSCGWRIPPTSGSPSSCGSRRTPCWAMRSMPWATRWQRT